MFIPEIFLKFCRKRFLFFWAKAEAFNFMKKKIRKKDINPFLFIDKIGSKIIAEKPNYKKQFNYKNRKQRRYKKHVNLKKNKLKVYNDKTQRKNSKGKR